MRLQSKTAFMLILHIFIAPYLALFQNFIDVIAFYIHLFSILGGVSKVTKLAKSSNKKVYLVKQGLFVKK